MSSLEGRLVTPRLLMPIVLFAVLVFFLIAPWVVAPYYLPNLTRIVIMSLLAVAFNIVFGLGGMPSLGHAGFFGVGAYTLALGVTRWEWGFGTVVLTTLLASGCVGLVYGLFCQRVKGIYLLLMTLALSQALWALAFQNVEITGGDMGISGGLRQVVPADLSDRAHFHIFVVLVVAVVIALLWIFVTSPVGRAIVGLRESESRLQTLGYDVRAYKVVAFVVSGMASGVAGALHGMELGFVGVASLEWTVSATVLLAAIVGGSRYFFGPALGIAVLLTAEDFVMGYTDRHIAVMGLIYMFVIILLPGGILGLRSGRRGNNRQVEEDLQLHERVPS